MKVNERRLTKTEQFVKAAQLARNQSIVTLLPIRVRRVVGVEGQLGFALIGDFVGHCGLITGIPNQIGKEQIGAGGTGNLIGGVVAKDADEPTAAIDIQKHSRAVEGGRKVEG